MEKRCEDCKHATYPMTNSYCPRCHDNASLPLWEPKEGARNCGKCKNYSAGVFWEKCVNCTSDHNYFEPKEVTMDYKAACEAINKVDDSIICSKGKDAVKRIIAALCGEKVEELFNSEKGGMSIGAEGSYYKCSSGKGICTIKHGALVPVMCAQGDGILTDSNGRIVVKSPCTVLKSDGTLVEVE